MHKIYFGDRIHTAPWILGLGRRQISTFLKIVLGAILENAKFLHSRLNSTRWQKIAAVVFKFTSEFVLSLEFEHQYFFLNHSSLFLLLIKNVKNSYRKYWYYNSIDRANAEKNPPLTCDIFVSARTPKIQRWSDIKYILTFIFKKVTSTFGTLFRFLVSNQHGKLYCLNILS